MTTFTHTLAPRLLAGFGTVALLAGIGLFASRPAHTAGGPIPVSVSNPVQNHDADNAALQPFGIRVFPSPTIPATFVVPAGKRLVIQQISAFSFGPTTAVDVEIETTLSGVQTGLRVPFTVNNHGIVYAAQSVTDYADPGSTVTVSVAVLNQNDTAGQKVDIRGYYVDLP